MRCPFCQSPNQKVVDKRDDKDFNRRRRECLDCKNRFTTYERIELKPLSIKKKDRTIEEFDKNKLRKGIVLATEKRNVSQEKIDTIIQKIEKQLRELKKKTVPTKLIGNLVMHELKKLDPVAYLRFASVYQNFKSTKAFETEIRKLK